MDDSRRRIPIYDQLSNTDSDETHLGNKKLSKKMKRKLAKMQKTDISENFSSLKPSMDNDSIHGIINMFDNETYENNDDEFWYENPEHIEYVEQFLKDEKWPFHSDNVSYFTENIPNQRDTFKRPKLSKRMQLKLNRKRNIKLKQRGINIENLNKNELIQRDIMINDKDELMSLSPDFVPMHKNENEDISLKVWDPIQKIFTHSPIPHTPKTEKSIKQRKQNKLASKWRKYERKFQNGESNVFDLGITNISPYWLLYNDIDPIILDQLSHRLPLSSRHFSKTPQGLYRMNDEIREILQKMLVNEYWPTGWAENKDEQIFAQRLFNAVHVKYDRRKVLRYIANEFPLSLSVNYRILKELKHRMPDFKPKGLIDFGQGPGCATIAALEIFNDSLKVCYGIETSSIMREFGTEILKKYNQDNKYHLAYLDSLDIQNAKEQPLVISSFVLSEINGGYDEICKYLDKLWLSTKKVLIFIESGTIDGYNLINFARSYLLSKYPPNDGKDNNQIPGTYTIAPCPHDKQCPLSSNHICRFIQRIDRHQVPTRCHFKADKKRTKYILSKNQQREKIKNKKTKLKDKRKIDEIQFPYSYCILGKGISPRLISPESNIFSQHFPHYFMNNKQSEQASYFWPRIIAPPKYRRNNLYLHLCLPQRPTHADINMDKLPEIYNKMLPSGEIKNDIDDIDYIDDNNVNNELMAIEQTFSDKLNETQVILPNSRVSGKLKLDNRKSAKQHINIVKSYPYK